MLWQYSLFMSICLTCYTAYSEEPRPLIGAIRWDAWHTPFSGIRHGGDGGPVKDMERSLGPGQYHYRVPFFGKIVSDNEVKIDGYTQAIVDQEIAYAKSGGIDYWAFLLYEPDDPMSQALSLYLSSKRRSDVGFCAIAYPNIFGEPQVFHDRMQRILKLMSEPSYQKVMGDRPLLYLFNVTDDWLEKWNSDAKRLFDDFRTAVLEASHGEPYIVIMDFNPKHGKKVADAIGAEALGSYATSSGGANAKYIELANTAQNFWKQCSATNSNVVPIVMSGWDRRPRVEHPVPWEKGQKPGVGIENYYQMPTPQELAAHIENAMHWVADRKSQSSAKTVIIYAWNEHDEGGWLCPTINKDGSANTERLDAIASVLKKFKTEE